MARDMAAGRRDLPARYWGDFFVVDRHAMARKDRRASRRMKKQQPSLDHLSASEWRGRELSNAVVLFHEKIAAHLGLNSAELKCLGLLDQHGPMTAGRLVELSRLTTGAITGVVDRLERAGYVRRERHPTDRRSVIVQPVKLGELKARVAPVFR